MLRSLVGSEMCIRDRMYDLYNSVNTLGFFLQSDWLFNENFTVLSGVRFDKHSLLSNLIISPRFSFLYNIKQNLQLRLSYSTGFRAPQAFDTDLHIAFSGGGISRISLDNDLKEENSQRFSSSFNYDYAQEN